MSSEHERLVKYPKKRVGVVSSSITNRMLLSHFLTRMGDKMWEFIIPLTLIAIAPETLLPSSLFGFATTLARVLFANTIGREIDVSSRLSVIFCGIFIQAISVLFSGCLLYLLLIMKSRAIASDIFHTWYSSLGMSTLLVSAVGGSLAALMMDISVERDWVPTAVKEETQLTLLNTRMRQVDLVTEVGAPFLAGILLVIPGVNETIAFLTVAAFNFVTFIPQYLLLKTVYYSVPGLQKPKSLSVESDGTDTGNGFVACICGDWNPIANIYRGWSLFVRLPITLLVSSFALLWLTVLSPHDIVFTAYLNDKGYTTLELGLFRGIGALFGFIATFAFPFFSNKWGLQKASLVYIWEEAIFVVGAGVLFYFVELYYNSHGNTITYTVLKYAFLVVIVFSRCGLYGFEVGEITLLQQGIPENVRGQVNSVESSLTNLASLLVFGESLVFSRPSEFYILVWTSSACILLGSLVYSLWMAQWEVRREEHSHKDDGNDDVGNSNSYKDHMGMHTTQHDDDLKLNNQVHTHTFFMRRRRNAVPRVGRDDGEYEANTFNRT